MTVTPEPAVRNRSEEAAKTRPPDITRTRRPFRRWVRDLGWRHLVGWIAIVYALFPVIWVVSASLNPLETLTSQRLLPETLTLDNYNDLLFGDVPYVNWYVNTVVIAGGASLVMTFLSALAAYAFSRMRFAGRRIGLLAILLVQMFPQVLAFVAIFLIMVQVGNSFPSIGLGTRVGLTLVYLGGALGVNTWLMKGFFDTVPRELDESAMVDGASHNQVYFRIILPLVAPILAVVFLLSFVLLINEFVLADAVLGQGDPENFTLAVGLFRYLSDEFNQRWGTFAAGALMAGVPVVVLFLFLQKYIVSGLTQGAVKG